MLFSSVTFLYVFLPVTLALYFLAPKPWRNAVLLVCSLLFYFFGEPVYTLLLLFSSLSDYLHSLYIEKHRGTKKAKAALISSIVLNLGLLGFFKYADFLIATVNGIFGLALPLTHVPLPIGISFFTFQTMSYTIDVYRGDVKAERNLATLATYVCLFPQLVAGPIVRYSTVAAELTERRSDWAGVGLGLRRFVFGLAKKVVIANAMGELAASFRASGDASVLYYWLYAFAFFFQIYFDFSGYSDMAIGLGRVFGFSFPENFDYPYLSKSLTEFWRRWHMTLGGWFRDYLYIPLGGNRVSKGRWLLNILVVWCATGLWHGAAWNFLLWGLFFGLMLILEKLWLQRWLNKAGKAVSHIYTLAFVLLSFVLFNAEGLSGAARDLGGLFGAGGLPLVSGEALYALRSYACLFVLAAIGCTPYPKRLAMKAQSHTWMAFAEPLCVTFLLLLCTACLIDGSFNPFLYFRF